MMVEVAYIFCVEEVTLSLRVLLVLDFVLLLYFHIVVSLRLASMEAFLYFFAARVYSDCISKAK